MVREHERGGDTITSRGSSSWVLVTTVQLRERASEVVRRERESTIERSRFRKKKRKELQVAAVVRSGTSW